MLSYSLFLSLSLILVLSHALSHALSYALSFILSLSFSCSLILSCSLSHMLSLSLRSNIDTSMWHVSTLTCKCYSCAWPLLCGSQTACRSHRCCTPRATQGSERFPAGSLFLKQRANKEEDLKWIVPTHHSLKENTHIHILVDNSDALLREYWATPRIMSSSSSSSSSSPIPIRRNGERKVWLYK